MRRVCFLALTAALLAESSAWAYRPFDGTDAGVANDGEAEIELGPVQWLREGSQRFLQVPAVIANFGFSRERELVVETRHQVALDPEPGQPRSSLIDSAVSMKQVLRNGVLQDASGPSVAAEYGLLLPDVNGERGGGVSLAGIVSQRWRAGTVHLNAQVARTREHEPELFLSAILEGPFAWRIRPVAEVFADRTSGSPRTDSILVGAIWRVRDGLSFDAGVRSAQQSGAEAIHEIRLGLTWAFDVKHER